MSQSDYDEYKEGHQAGEEVAEELEEASTMEIAEGQLKRLLIENPYAGKSEMWWKGFKDGKLYNAANVHSQDTPPYRTSFRALIKAKYGEIWRNTAPPHAQEGRDEKGSNVMPSRVCGAF